MLNGEDVSGPDAAGKSLGRDIQDDASDEVKETPATPGTDAALGTDAAPGTPPTSDAPPSPAVPAQPATKEPATEAR